MSENLYDVALKRIDGSNTTLDAWRGQVLLVVNVASKCGLTPQYTALEQLFKDKQARGLQVLGFPANDFAGQEPGSDAEIASFCSTSYDVTFPMFAKIPVVGAAKHPLYRRLTESQPNATGDGVMRKRLRDYGIEPNPAPEVLWNFEKFLIGRDGRVAERFEPDVSPDDPRLVAAIDRELAKPA